MTPRVVGDVEAMMSTGSGIELRAGWEEGRAGKEGSQDVGPADNERASDLKADAQLSSTLILPPLP